MPITLNDFKEGGSLRNFVTQVGLLGKIDKEGVDQDKLLSTLINAVTVVGTYTDSNKDGKVTKDDAVSEKFSKKEDGGDDSGEGGDDPIPTPTPDPEPDPTPDPEPDPEETVTHPTFKIVASKRSWDAAYANGNGPLGAYYNDHPEEDLWNTAENRAVTFDDRWYTGTIDGQEVSCGTAWAADGVQKITVDETDYYTPIWGYDLAPHNAELFTNVELTESAGKTFNITTVSFSDDCKHCWEGSINAPGAAYPWLVITLPVPTEGKIEIEGGNKLGNKKVYPWGNEYKSFEHGYAICSIPTEFENDSVKINPATGAAEVKIISTDVTVNLITVAAPSVLSGDTQNNG